MTYIAICSTVVLHQLYNNIIAFPLNSKSLSISQLNIINVFIPQTITLYSDHVTIIMTLALQ